MENYLVINSDNEVEYEITRKMLKGNTITSIYNSDSNIWSQDAKGEFQNAIVDTGNGIIFNNIRKKMDYADFMVFRILIEFNSCLDKNLSGDYRVIEDKTLMRL